MYKDSTILAVITARGGSKGVPGKNIRALNGKPLIAHTIEAALAARQVDRVILSTDSSEIADVARRHGCDVPFIRPSELAQDTSDTRSVIEHALGALPVNYDYVVVLQPTSPFRTAEDIDLAIETCISRRAPTCASVCDVDKSPYWMVIINSEGRVEPLLPAPPISRRQDSPHILVFNGGVYVAEVRAFLEGQDLTGPGTVAYWMPKSRSLDIDTEADFLLAEFLAAAGKR